MKSPKLLLFYLIYLVSLNIANAQKAPFKFGKVSLEELNMTQYELDTSAVAVVLGDYGTTGFTYNNDSKGFQLIFERTRRVKILKKEGSSFANDYIPLYHRGRDKEKIMGFKATTYNLVDGKIVETKLKSEGMFEEAYNDNLDHLNFTMPNVNVGSVIEYTYKVVSDFTFNLQDWAFQSTIPTVVSEYRVRIPEFFTYQQYMQGYVALKNLEKKDVDEKFLIRYQSAPKSGGAVSRGEYDLPSRSKEQRFVAYDVPAFIAEEFTSNPYNYISKINFELASVHFPQEPVKNIMGTWGSVNTTYLNNESFGEQINGSNYLKEEVMRITSNLENDNQKIETVYNYVKNNVEWSGRNGTLATQSFKKVLADKKGNAADINLLLVSMLKKAGIKADPMLISTREHGMVIEQFPLSSQFNYVIAYVPIDNGYILLDATDRSLPINMLPERCINGKGLVISESQPSWKNTSGPASSIKNACKVALSENGNLSGTQEITYSGYQANRIRKRYFRDKEAYVKAIEENDDMEITHSGFVNLNEINEPLKENLAFKLENGSSNPGLIYLNPILNSRLSSNPFKLESRQYPVDFTFANDELFYFTLTIPENYEVEELPKSLLLSLPDNSGKYTYRVVHNGNTIMVINQVTINKATFVGDEYPNLKEFYNQIVAKQAEQIVLKRKN